VRDLVVLLLLLPSVAWAETLTGTTCDPSSSVGCVNRSVSAYHSVAVSLTGTWTGAVVFEVAPSSAGPFHSTRAYQPDGGGTYATTATQNGAWTAVTGGFPYFRVRATSLMSGSIVVTAQASNYVVPADIVRAVGGAFGDVAVTGAVELGAATKAAIAAPTCTFSDAPPILALTTTPQAVPATPLENRTQLVVKNLSTVQPVWCCRGTNCTPTSTAAYVILPNGDFQSFPARSTDVIRCRAALATTAVNAQESSCE
jgi:hypothetical protein